MEGISTCLCNYAKTGMRNQASFSSTISLGWTQILQKKKEKKKIDGLIKRAVYLMF
jgi:hypothetical protein